MKKWSKKKRTFVNPSNTDCLGALSWHVDFTPGKPNSKHKWDREGGVEAEFSVNDGAQHHYVSRKGHLRAIQLMIKELQAFEAAATAALNCLEEDKDASC